MSFGVTVQVRNNDVKRGIGTLKRLMGKDGIFRRLKAKGTFIRKGEMKRHKRMAAQQRKRKYERRREREREWQKA